MDLSQTIAAIATPPGVGGIGIIRISGHSAKTILGKIFQAQGKPPGDLSSLLPFQLKRGKIIHPIKRIILDEVLAVIMPSPGTYTGEEVVEIQGHGGAVVLGQILEVILEHGARLAEPGEFTRRAFLNGRLDLSQAEAVVDLIHARTSVAAQIAARHTGGELGEKVQKILDALLFCRANIEASLDFAEDTEDQDFSALMQDLQSNVIEPLTGLVKDADHGSAYTKGLKVAIVGQPNVGKSSLMNALTGQDRSIVTPTPGTTRDVVREDLLVQGLYFTLADTAGLRLSPDPIEAVGIDKANETLEQADMVLVVVDASLGFDEQSQDILRRALEANTRIIAVANKIDLAGDNPIQISGKEYEAVPVVCTTAITGQGVEDLRTTMVQAASYPGPQENVPRVVPNLRQKQCLENALSNSQSGFQRVQEESWELAAIDLETAQSALEQVLGTGVSPDILDSIFSRFCIGK